MDIDHPLIAMLTKLAQTNPQIKEKLDKLTGFDKAQEARIAVKEFCDGFRHRGYDAEHLAFGLAVNLVLLEYIQCYGNRAEARDKLGELIDNCFTVTDNTARSNGLYDELRKAEIADKNGDEATKQAIIDSNKKFVF